jgi:inosose dehydratase
MLTRRSLLATAPAPLLGAPQRYRIGITTNTRGGWEKDVFLSFREAREAGYRNVESFIHYFTEFWDKPQALKEKIDEIGVRFVTISNGRPLEMRFEDPARHGKIIEDHLRLVRFIKQFGCNHLKINLGGRRPDGTTSEDLKHMAVVLNELGKRITDEGLKFGIHAHMWSQFETRQEVDRILESTDPKHVWFILDTGHITLAGIDPVELTRRLGHRIVEFHMKDVAPEYRGGAKIRHPRHDAMNNPLLFPLGKGGVDFQGIKARLDSIAWNGWLTIELDSSPDRPPKESAVISRRYLEQTLGLKV